MTVIAAIAACALLAGLTVFQILLIAGMPWGHFAWGGAHKVLPKNLRIGSAISILIYLFCALIILEKAGITSVIPADAASDIGIWVLAVYFTLGIFLNAISRSKPERMTMTPIVIVLAALVYIVALQIP